MRDPVAAVVANSRNLGKPFRRALHNYNAGRLVISISLRKCGATTNYQRIRAMNVRVRELPPPRGLRRPRCGIAQPTLFLISEKCMKSARFDFQLNRFAVSEGFCQPQSCIIAPNANSVQIFFPVLSLSLFPLRHPSTIRKCVFISTVWIERTAHCTDGTRTTCHKAP